MGCWRCWALWSVFLCVVVGVWSFSIVCGFAVLGVRLVVCAWFVCSLKS